MLTKNELQLLTRLYDLYVVVIDTVNSWKEMIWSEAIEKMDEMKDQIDNFGNQCKNLPRKLKDWEAYI